MDVEPQSLTPKTGKPLIKRWAHLKFVRESNPIVAVHIFGY